LEKEGKQKMSGPTRVRRVSGGRIAGRKKGFGIGNKEGRLGKN